MLQDESVFDLCIEFLLLLTENLPISTMRGGESLKSSQDIFAYIEQPIGFSNLVVENLKKTQKSFKILMNIISYNKDQLSLPEKSIKVSS